MPMIDAIVAEMTQEAAGARRMLERLPEGKGDWKPHEKSMPLSRLAAHIAEIPGWAPTVLGQDELDFGEMEYEPSHAHTATEAVEMLDASLTAFREAAAGVSDEHLMGEWTMRTGDEVHLRAPRVVALRTFVMNHLYHHRGQLTVFLRLLDVPVPGTYGPTADEPGM